MRYLSFQGGTVWNISLRNSTMFPAMFPNVFRSSHADVFSQHFLFFFSTRVWDKELSQTPELHAEMLAISTYKIVYSIYFSSWVLDPLKKIRRLFKQRVRRTYFLHKVRLGRETGIHCIQPIIKGIHLIANGVEVQYHVSSQIPVNV